MTPTEDACLTNTKLDVKEVSTHDAKQDVNGVATHQPDKAVGLSMEEEASLIEASNSLKVRANALFGEAEFAEAITTYEQALTRCPPTHEYEAVVLRSNLAACYLKLANWKEAKKAATAAFDGLEKIQPADATRQAEYVRIRIKVLLRRAHANRELGGWAGLQSALDDYQALSQMPTLLPHDRALVHRQLILLPSRTEAAQKEEMGQLMGQLKQLGNGLLKPFGLSTDNFQMQKDEKSGGYSMNFHPGTSKK
ncbi:hypothetical protein K3495_g1272 [Podosphaera aphanis]|nr:hypothetical protein K3495_g1272 [Podosphaera aphanis]